MPCFEEASLISLKWRILHGTEYMFTTRMTDRTALNEVVHNWTRLGSAL